MSSYYGDKSANVPSWERLEAGDDDDVVDTSEYQYASRDHVLFCIDASTSMQAPSADQSNKQGTIRGISPLQQVLNCVVGIERGKVITGPADSIGVLLYNVDPAKAQTTGTGNYKPGTFVYQPLRMINAEEIKRIIKLKERYDAEYSSQEEDEETVQPPCVAEKIPPCKPGEELNIADVLVTCNFLFRDAGTKLAGNKRVFLVTNSDDPPGSTHRDPARTVYGDLLTYGITINTFFVDTPDHRFDPTLYWNDILGRDENEDKPTTDTEPDLEGVSKLEDIMNDLVIRHAPKRVQFSIPLKLGGRDGDIEIGVSGFAMVSVQGKGQPKYVRMRGQTVEEVLVKSEYTSAETGAVLRDEEIGQAYQFGNEGTIRNILERNWWETNDHQAEQQALADEVLRLDQERREKEANGKEEMQTADKPKPLDFKMKGANGDIKPKLVARTRLQFTPDEISEFKSMGLGTEIKIIGFQSPDRLRLEENIRHSYFIYPNEDAYSGSTRTFAALLKSCLKYNRHALTISRFRANSAPDFAVLIPQAETTTNGGQDDPPGFHVIPLPYKDDIRAPPKNMTENLTADEREIKLMTNIIKRLRVKHGKYYSANYPNPALRYHFAQLEALAFEEDFDLQQRIDDIDKTYPKYHGMHTVAGDFMAEFNKAIEEDERCVDVPRRGGTKRSAATAAEIDEDDLADVVGAYRDGKIDKLKVQELRDWAKFKKIALTGATKKADIIELLKEQLEKEVSGKKTKSK